MTSIRKSTLIRAVALVLPCTVCNAFAATPSGDSGTASPVNPYAQHVVRTSNQGLQRDLSDFGPNDGDAAAVSTSTGTVSGAAVDIPTFDGGCTEGFFCSLLTIAPAQGCLETQLAKCTQQTWCTSNTRDKCTINPTCTQASRCTNTQGCTDAGQCTQANGCTGTAQCTSSAGCTQHSSCTNGTWCTNDAGTCTGGATCTQGTGCTNGTNCTSGAGCTKDAQCTSGPQCTRGANCTRGTGCTSGSSCPSTLTTAPGCTTSAACSSAPLCNPATTEPGCTTGDACTVVTTAHSGELGHGDWHASALERLNHFGAPTPESEPHFAPAETMDAAAWLGLLLIPSLFLRRRSQRGAA